MPSGRAYGAQPAPKSNRYITTTGYTNPLTHRGYRYTSDELADFREFKTSGAIPRQARPESYAIDLIVDERGYHHAQLWAQTRPGHERPIAALLACITLSNPANQRRSH